MTNPINKLNSLHTQHKSLTWIEFAEPNLSWKNIFITTIYLPFILQYMNLKILIRRGESYISMIFFNAFRITLFVSCFFVSLSIYLSPFFLSLSPKVLVLRRIYGRFRPCLNTNAYIIAFKLVDNWFIGGLKE